MSRITQWVRFVHFPLMHSLHGLRDLFAALSISEQISHRSYFFEKKKRRPLNHPDESSTHCARADAEGASQVVPSLSDVRLAPPEAADRRHFSRAPPKKCLRGRGGAAASCAQAWYRSAREKACRRKLGSTAAEVTDRASRRPSQKSTSAR